MTLSFKTILMAAGTTLVLAGCQKMDRPALGDYPPDTNPSDGPLSFYAAFDGSTTDPLMNAVDSIRANFPLQNPLLTVAGVSGNGVKGVDGKAIAYPSANTFKNAKSFSIAFWLKNTPQVGRTEFLFALGDPSYDWAKSAFFLLVENQTNTKATVKFNLMDQWLEGDITRPMFDNNWHHIAYVYDQTTSKMNYYFDGAAITGLTATQTDVKKGGAPRGAVDFSKANKLIVGGWGKHANSDGPGDDWIKSFNGNMDQFRLYTKALTATEVQTLFTTKK